MPLLKLRKLQLSLLEWYDSEARVLPWRLQAAGSRDGYQVWLSEVLLQQTQVSRAILYFQNFLEAFPDVRALAAAPLEDVLKLWEGAGYYARARSLHRAAQIMAVRGLPSSFEAWLELPGVGRYTAAAIASLSANQAVAAVDGNVRRVLARLHNNPNPTESWLLETAQDWLFAARAGAWNEALIELGAVLCTPKKPRCSDCPLSSFCKANLEQTTSRVPAPKTRAKVKTIQALALIQFHADLVFLEQRPKKGLLGGLFGVPLMALNADAASTLEELGIPDAQFLGTVSHTMTHRQFEVVVYAIQSKRSDLVLAKNVALSRLDQKILALLQP